MKYNDWIFTCSLEPKRFSHFTDESDDDFETVEGSSHSKKHCSLTHISDKYANWFIKNRCWELFQDDIADVWVNYEQKIKELCIRDNIEYEGF